jgi:hypothetical protein
MPIAIQACLCHSLGAESCAKSTTKQPTNKPTKQPPCTQSATYPGPKRVARGRMRGVNECVEKQFAETQPVEMLKFGDAGRHDDPRWKNPCRSKNNERTRQY